MHSALRELQHRPWPMPQAAWKGRQSWCDLLFAHWPVSTEQLRPLVPPGLEIQEFEGTSWIGVVPFRMQGVMLRGVPDLPWISAFPELNVRIYVEHEGKPGVWFLSLDATNPLAIWTARRFVHLPYFRAVMSLTEDADGYDYSSKREGAEFRGRYAPTSDVYRAAPGSLEHWLTERYCLYAARSDGALFRTEVHHAPWPLQSAWARLDTNTMCAVHGVSVSGPPALLHFSKRIDVVTWTPQRVR